MSTVFSGTGTRSPITIAGLPAGSYLFTVTATDSSGTQAAWTTSVPVAVTQILNPSAADDVRDVTARGAVVLGRTTRPEGVRGTFTGTTAFSLTRPSAVQGGAADVLFALNAPTGLVVGTRLTVSLWVRNTSNESATCAFFLADARRTGRVSPDAAHLELPAQSPWLECRYDTAVLTAASAATALFLQLPADGPISLEVTNVSVAEATSEPGTDTAGSGDVATFTSRAPVGPVGTFTLRAADDFTGRELDPARWWDGRYRSGSEADPPFNPAAEAEYFASSQVSVADSLLTLTVTDSEKRVDGTLCSYRSGCVTSNAHLRFRPVGTFVEARIRFSRAPGLWPAFWLVSDQGYTSEFDIFEFFDTSTHVRPSYNYHYPSPGSAYADRQSEGLSYGEPDVAYNVGFHTYGLLTTATTQVPYLDGVAYQHAAVSGMTTRDDQVELVFSLAVQRGHRPAPGQTMDVDWVRIWGST